MNIKNTLETQSKVVMGYIKKPFSMLMEAQRKHNIKIKNKIIDGSNRTKEKFSEVKRNFNNEWFANEEDTRTDTVNKSKSELIKEALIFLGITLTILFILNWLRLTDIFYHRTNLIAKIVSFYQDHWKNMYRWYVNVANMLVFIFAFIGAKCITQQNFYLEDPDGSAVPNVFVKLGITIYSFAVVVLFFLIPFLFG